LVRSSFVYGKDWNGKVVKVIDGDSLLIKQGREIYEIRLYGIDAPEYGQDYGKKAKSYLRKYILYKNVSVEPKDIDKYHRIVALVYNQGDLVNKELVRAGMAWVYHRYCKEEALCSEMKALEQAARDMQSGLWCVGNPVSPWNWKKHKR